MTAISYNTTDAWDAHVLLESQALENVAATASIQKAIAVPQRATTAQFLFVVTNMAGTSPLLDFIVQGVDPYNVDDGYLYNLGDWDGITQLTSAAATVVVAVDIGPNYTADDTGSATASCRYAVQAALPPVLVYKITYDGTTTDEDYTFTLSRHFKG